ncbi:hypothetical protein JNUCC1_03319 [Lentibacillus sp. JNUCC-1]|nr:hypothetical protein [Lentibacillus sp. JNUCC-1]
MDINKHFLIEDRRRADREYRCFKDLMCDVVLLIDSNRMDAAKERMIDMNQSLNELACMSTKKYEEDKFLRNHNELVKRMHEEGIQFEVLRSVYGDGLR